MEKGEASDKTFPGCVSLVCWRSTTSTSPHTPDQPQHLEPVPSSPLRGTGVAVTLERHGWKTTGVILGGQQGVRDHLDPQHPWGSSSQSWRAPCSSAGSFIFLGRDFTKPWFEGASFSTYWSVTRGPKNWNARVRQLIGLIRTPLFLFGIKVLKFWF